VAILVNALFLQSGPHPAPLFKTTLASLPSSDATNALPPPRPSSAAPAPAKTGASALPLPPRRPDPIGDMLNSSKRIMAIQRALAQFGYGQIKATGVVDADTRAAIEKFERESRLPVTGQPSELVAQKLSEMTDRPLN
jgi:peptidoglycan hydrolase-like protein with peptidoglycan-binding domain